MKTVRVATVVDVKEGELCTVKVDGQAVLVSRVDGKLCAFSAKCPHIGLSLGKGKIADGAITCPWHGSRFDLRTGANLDWTNSFAGKRMPAWSHGLLAMGKKPAPLRMFEAAREGSVYVTVRIPDFSRFSASSAASPV